MIDALALLVSHVGIALAVWALVKSEKADENKNK
ncbi:MAG: hypothetical protein ACI808_003076 [Paraglaciecola sp.]|jgi:hypothetical protein